MGLFKKKNSNNVARVDVSKSKISKVINPKSADDKGFFTACSPEQLLNIHQHVISVIDSNTRLSQMHFDMYYRKTIANYAALVQAFPASEYHHHSYPTGLIEHSLDVARAAVVYARKFLFTETGVESEMEEFLDVFMFACFTAALLHDAGKVVTDLDVVYFNDKNQICAWLPFGESQLKEGTRYKWRYNSVRNKLAHESAAPTLVQTIVPFEGIYWIRSRTPRLWQEWLHTIAGRNQFGGDIGKVIEYCDSYSVQKSMSGKSSKDGQNTNTRHTLSERFVIAFRQLIESGALPLNRKGAGAWLKDDFIYFVSQRAVEAAIPLVKNAGGTGIPNKDVTIFSLLCDGGVALRHEETNDVVHSMNITLNDESWSGDLTFLKVAVDTIDPNGSLGLVEGNITLVDNTSKAGFNAKRDAKNETKNTDSENNGSDNRDSCNSLTSDLMSNAFSSLGSSKEKQPAVDGLNTTDSAMASSLDSMFGDMGKRKPQNANGKNKSKIVNPASAEPKPATNDNALDFASILGDDKKVDTAAATDELINIDNVKFQKPRMKKIPGNIISNKELKDKDLDEDTSELSMAVHNSADAIDAIFADTARSDANIVTNSKQEIDIDKLFLADANSRNRKTIERTDYIKQREQLIDWLDNGIAGGSIRYNKLTSQSNYCYNTKNGWFVCLWSAISAYNESNSDQIKLERVERVITELKNARLLHLDNKSNACREAVVSKHGGENITLRGVYFKKNSLVKAADNSNYVKPSLFTIIP
ncbi:MULTISPECIES: MobH family relaxase [Photobacterium]|uniref:Uncharacterized domain-containing protein n=1 Tax=Photobacterium carnosum TaxID=2023717 RepID=A0A2N4UPN2_9GAMM|nr:MULTISPECIES: MobH family relaxase [Photobacterium]MBY3789018.1 hypothetical protein [Photobacterium carnosum]MCD9463381.1 hypothetical protein [Photobacterium phosphoreum]MCD9502229.1 hypothetical protein [Photobacterium phosphoreum]MCD9512452.1 hypothetical protein [Photobacterium phosphoreum]MCD9534669.1 hypothetical protein [Photobacterium carnosum]